MVGNALAIEAHVPQLDSHALQVFGLPQVSHAPRSREEGFGRNTAPVDTGAAHGSRFHDGGFEATTHPMKGCAMIAYSGPQDDQIVIKGLAHNWFLNVMTGARRLAFDPVNLSIAGCGGDRHKSSPESLSGHQQPDSIPQQDGNQNTPAMFYANTKEFQRNCGPKLGQWRKNTLHWAYTIFLRLHLCFACSAPPLQ